MKRIFLLLVMLNLVLFIHVYGQSTGGVSEEEIATISGINNWDNDSFREEWAYSVGLQAYIWGYPLVDHYNRFIIQSEKPALAIGTIQGKDAAPVGTINHICFLSNFTTPLERFIGAPNQDVLYGNTYFDLTDEPVVLRIPDMGDRYWIAEMCYSTTEVFASPGTRRGSVPGKYLIVGPDWDGSIPDDIVEVLHAPDNKVNILFRVLVNGKEDIPIVRPLINNVTSGTLCEIDTIPTTIDYQALPRVELPNSERDWVPDDSFWSVFRLAIQNTLHRQNESALIALFQQTGLNTSDDQAINRGLSRAITQGRAMVWDKSRFNNLGSDTLPYGWNTVLRGGEFGTDYLTRAAQAPGNTYIHLPEDCLYYYQEVDSQGMELNGKNRYSIHFSRENLPPHSPKAFWSLTVYDDSTFLFENPFDRYNVGSATSPPVAYNEDGSLDILLQSDKPAEYESNWIPIVEDEPFQLYLRVYMPDQSALDGSYYPPPVEKIE